MKTHHQIDNSLLEIWCGAEEAASVADYRGDLQEMHRAMGVTPRRRFHTVWFVSAAAAVLLVVMAGEYFFLRNRTALPVETVALVTSASSKGEFVLPDGSHVWLNSASSLTYDKANPRQVTLQGEGFFDVAKKDGQEFVVCTGNVAVKVLGTRFNVRSSSHFEREEVSLVSGRVRIEAGENAVYLSPGERAGIDASLAIDKQQADVTFDAAWIGQELVFENVSLSDILTSLEHWYNVNISVGPQVNLASRLSFKVRKESLPESQRIISRLTGCQFKTLDEKNILITKR